MLTSLPSPFQRRHSSGGLLVSAVGMFSPFRSLLHLFLLLSFIMIVFCNLYPPPIDGFPFVWPIMGSSGLLIVWSSRGTNLCKCRAQKIGHVLHKTRRKTHPNEMASGGTSTEALPTNSSKCDGEVAVVLMMGHQEMENSTPVELQLWQFSTTRQMAHQISGLTAK